jgi:hypothetical protein
MQSFAAGEVTAVVLPVIFVACLAAGMMMIYVGQLFHPCIIAQVGHQYGYLIAC